MRSVWLSLALLLAALALMILTPGPASAQQPGAVLIKDAAGHIVGAAGASGGTGDEDEACCAYGAEQAGLKPVI